MTKQKQSKQTKKKDTTTVIKTVDNIVVYF